MYLPPLRNRREDIPLLIEKFVKDVLNNESITFAGFTEDAINLIKNYSWPGNIRELRNFVETIVVLARGQQITSQMVKDQLSKYEEPVIVSSALPMPIGISREDAERELVYKALVSLGLEVKEMRTMLMQLIEQSNGFYRENPVYSSPENESTELEIKPLEEIERDVIKSALDKFNGNRRKVARVLNISERTLYRKLKEYDLADKSEFSLDE